MMPRLSTSTWSLHKLLGQAWYEPGGGGLAAGAQLVNKSAATPTMMLLDVPHEIARHGIRTLEICHFHFPSIDRTYLAELSSAARDAGVELFSLLIDTGDPTAADPAKRARDMELIRAWMDVAAALGASHVRVNAGSTPVSSQMIDRSATNLRELAGHARGLGLRTITENWHATSKEPEALLEILDRCDGAVGLCVDFGNAEGPRKHETIDLLAPRGTSVHAKARRHPDGTMDLSELDRCVAPLRAAGFDGPVSLIRDGSAERWEELIELRDALVPLFGITYTVAGAPVTLALNRLTTTDDEAERAIRRAIQEALAKAAPDR